jgi:hypothetical protein
LAMVGFVGNGLIVVTHVAVWAISGRQWSSRRIVVSLMVLVLLSSSSGEGHSNTV